MNTFFYIRKESDLNIIGDYDQTKFDPLGAIDNSIIYKDGWINLISNQTQFELTLKRRGKKTDFLINSPLIGPDSLCYSKRLNEYINSYLIDDTVRAKVKLIHNLNVYEYSFIKFINKRLEYIDWEQSKFAKTNWSIFEKEISINSQSEYKYRIH